MSRILVLTERFPPDLGGVARSSARTALSLASQGFTTEVFTWTRSIPPGRLESTPLPFPAPGLPASPVVVHRLGLFANLDFSLQYTMNVLDWLQRERHFELVWGHYVFPAGFLAVLMAEKHGIRSAVSARGNDIDRLMFPPGDFSRLLWTLQRAHAVSAVSRDLADKIRLLLGGNPTVHTLPNAVDTDLFTPGPAEPGLRQALSIEEDEAVLGFCGELRQKKGLTFLLQALDEIRATRPACLLVIGEVRSREQALLASYAAEHPASAQRILVTGSLEAPAEVARHLRLCDLVLMPSLWDGLPNALLEAMACERLVLASDAGGIPEVVESGREGFLLPKSDLDRLGTAALELLELSPETSRAIRVAARQRVRTQHHPGIEAAALARVLGTLGVAPRSS